MPDAPKINQLDPFGDNESEFDTQKIRHSRSRETRNLIKNVVDPKTEKDKKRYRLVVIILIVVILLSILGLFLIPRLVAPEEAIEDNPDVNPTGREATSEYADTAADDPELRTSEQDKLNTVLSLVGKGDWEFANAIFETIFPRYLDDCGKYDYYRAALSISENFENFSIDVETITTRRNVFYERCGQK